MKKHMKNLALLGLIVTAVIVGINKTISIIANNTSENLSIGRGKFYKWKFGDIYYTKTGEGSPVLLVHNLEVSGSAFEWHKIIQKLSVDHTVYAIDLLGCGRSEKPNITYSNYLYVQLITDFIKNVIRSKASIVTSGDSISFAIMSCQMNPDLFDKIIAISPSDLYDLAKTPGKRKNLLKYLIEAPVIGTFIYNMNTSHSHIQDKMMNKRFFKPHLVSKDLLRAYYQAAHNGDGYGRFLLASIKSNYTNVNIVPTLKKINHSIFLIGGEENLFMSDIMQDYLEYNAAIETSLLPETGFYPQLENPGKVLNFLQIYLA